MYCRLNKFIYLFINFFNAALLVCVCCIIVLLGQIFAHLFLKGKYVALCSNLIG